ncbi:hypothetical protein ZWY2020_021016 [Hordeum vulgare]|nr:hypothetical protein ZWY2020_021016 [Hordeum vulgare]
MKKGKTSKLEHAKKDGKLKKPGGRSAPLLGWIQGDFLQSTVNKEDVLELVDHGMVAEKSWRLPEGEVELEPREGERVLLLTHIERGTKRVAPYSVENKPWKLKACEIGSKYAKVESEKNQLQLDLEVKTNDFDALKKTLEHKDKVLAEVKERSEAAEKKLFDVGKLQEEITKLKKQRFEWGKKLDQMAKRGNAMEKFVKDFLTKMLATLNGAFLDAQIARVAARCDDTSETAEIIEVEPAISTVRTSSPRYELPDIPEGYVMEGEIAKDFLACKDSYDLEKLLQQVLKAQNDLLNELNDNSVRVLTRGGRMTQEPLYPEGHPKRIEQYSQGVSTDAPSHPRKKKKYDRNLHANNPVAITPESPNDVSVSHAETQSGDEHEPNDNIDSDA